MRPYLAIVFVLCGCSCTPRPAEVDSAGKGHNVTTSAEHAIPDDPLQRNVGHLFFAVGGGRNVRTKGFEQDPAYQAFSVVFVPGNQAFRRDTGRIFVIGIESSEGKEILRILDNEAPWEKAAEDMEVAANHLVFAGELNGRQWKYSRPYPDATIDRLVRSIGRVLDHVHRH